MTGIVKTDQLQGAQGTTVTVPTGHTLAVTSNATVGGNLTVDTDTLFADATNDKVGINNSSPNHELQINGNSTTSSLSLKTSATGNTTSDGLILKVQGDSAAFLYNYENAMLRFGTNGLERIRIDADGRVTMPNQVSFMQKEQPNVSGNNIIKGGVTDHNIGSHLNTTTGVFTAPIAGRYLFTAGVLTNASNARMEIFIRKNGNNYIAGNEVTGSSNYGSPVISVIYQLAANDTTDLYLSSGTMYSGHPSNYFSGCLLG